MYMLSCTCTDRSLAVIRETYGDGTSVTVQISRNTEGTTDTTGRWSETRHSTLWQMTSDPEDTCRPTAVTELTSRCTSFLVII